MGDDGDVRAPATSLPGSVDVARGFGQQPPPPAGFSSADFDARLQIMAEQEAQLTGPRDYRAVFHLTYLTFSRRIRDALAANRFDDPDWAVDMSCRFVDAYLEQLARWEQRDTTQCRAWRIAFGAARSGRANVLQAMFLGMNAHIHYDLAFVTLGACRAAGDLDERTRHRSLISRSGVPDRRHRDFLVVNQVAWESIPSIQETVLTEFAPVLDRGNRFAGRLTSRLGQRLLMEARDAAWAQTNLLVHAPSEPDRLAVGALIDAHAAGFTTLVGAVTGNPLGFVDGVRRWRDRTSDLPPKLHDRLVGLVTSRPLVADLALRQLAAIGADPAAVMDTLVGADHHRAAGVFAAMVARHAPAGRRTDLARYLRRTAHRSGAALDDVVAAGRLPIDMLPHTARWRVRAARRAALEQSRRCLADPEVAARSLLVEALRDHEQRLSAQLEDAAPASWEQPGPPTRDEVRAMLAAHPDAWVRACAAGSADGPGGSGGRNMPDSIEQVLFLRTTQVFREVDAASLLPVAEELEHRAFDAGDTLIRQSEHVEGVHLVTAGRVQVRQHRSGATVNVAELGPGDSLGELSALNDMTATADCIALTDVRTVFLATEVLATLLHQHPAIAVGLVRTLSERLAATTLRIGEPPAP